MGIESRNFDVRKNVSGGRFGQDATRETVRKIKFHGINVLGSYMFGLPEDDMNRMQQTLNLAIELNCEVPNRYSVMTYPGSELYNEPVENGWKVPDSLAGYSQHSYDCQPLPTKSDYQGKF